MVQTSSQTVTLDEFLKLPEIDTQKKTVFVYSSDRGTEVFDQPEAILPVPEFAQDFRLTVGELFGWLLE